MCYNESTGFLQNYKVKMKNQNLISTSPDGGQPETSEPILADETQQALIKNLTIEKLGEDQQAKIIELGRLAISDETALSMLAASKKIPDGLQLNDEQLKRFSETHVFEVAGGLGEILDEIANNNEPGIITQAAAEARKLFNATVFDEITKLEQADPEAAKDKAWSAYRKLYGMSPSIISYVGGFGAQLELLAIAEQGDATGKVFARDLIDEMVYDYSFSDSKIIEKAILGKAPIEQIRTFNVLQILADSSDSDSWTRDLYKNIAGSLERLIEDSATTPFVRLSAQSLLEEITKEQSAEWGYLEDLPLEEQSRLIAKDRQFREEERQFQDILHQAFPEAPEKAKLKEISADAVAYSTGLGVKTIYLTGGGTIDLTRDDDSGWSKDEKYLIKSMNNSAVREQAEAELGISMNQLTLEEQRRLLHFMIESDDQQYARLVEQMQHAPEDKRIILANSFLALEFGEDFGGKLLDVAEKTEQENLYNVLALIDSIRRRSEVFAESFGEFSADITKAIGERITEILYTLDALNKHGEVTEQFAGRDLSVNNPQQITVALKAIERALLKINQATEHKSVLAYDKNGVKMWNLGENGEVLFKIRPYGTNTDRDSAVEYGGGASAEATINFAVNVLGTDAVPPEISNGVRDGALSIRIDREEIEVDESGAIVGRDAEADKRTVALDIGSAIGGEIDNINLVVGQVIAVGSILRAKANQAESRGYHTTLPDQLGQKAAFADLATAVANRVVKPEREALVGQKTVGHVSQRTEKPAA
jgi:hypothetical protein